MCIFLVCTLILGAYVLYLFLSTNSYFFLRNEKLTECASISDFLHIKCHYIVTSEIFMLRYVIRQCYKA